VIIIRGQDTIITLNGCSLAKLQYRIHLVRWLVFSELSVLKGVKQRAASVEC